MLLRVQKTKKELYLNYLISRDQAEQKEKCIWREMLVLELKQHFKFPLSNFELSQEAGKAAPSAGSWSAGSWRVKQRHLELRVLSPAAQEQVSWGVKQLDFKEEIVDEARESQI